MVVDVVSVVIIDILIDSIVIDVITNRVLILFNEVSFCIDLECMKRVRIVNVLRKGVP